MTQQQWDLIGYGVWALIIWVTIKQFLQTKRPISGSGLRLLFGDWLMFVSLPWIVYCMESRATWEQIISTIGIGIVLAIPYILTTNFRITPTRAIIFKSNILFYLFLFGFPYLRYTIRDHVFHTYPILTANHRPDIELMLAMYIAVLVTYTFVWRLNMYLKYKQTVKMVQRIKSESKLNRFEYLPTSNHK